MDHVHVSRRPRVWKSQQDTGWLSVVIQFLFMATNQLVIEGDSRVDFDSITLPEDFGTLELSLSPTTPAWYNHCVVMSDPPASASEPPLFLPEQQAWLVQWMASRLPQTATATSNPAPLAAASAPGKLVIREH